MGLWILIWSPFACAALISTEELCAHGDANVCRDAELVKIIGATGQFGVDGKYAWKPTEKMLTKITTNTFAERTARRAQLLCTQVSHRWVSKEVSEYEQSSWSLAVDRHRYDDCMVEELPKAKTEELKAIAIRSSTAIASALVPVIAFFLFWYRRPLSRRIRNAMKLVSGIGAD